MCRAGESAESACRLLWLISQCSQAVSDYGPPQLTNQQVFWREALCELLAGAERLSVPRDHTSKASWGAVGRAGR